MAMLAGAGNQSAYLGGVIEVSLEQECVSAQSLNLLTQALRISLRLTVVNDHITTCPRDSEGKLAPNPTGSTSDKHQFIVK
jgi:hypothetical protein